MSFDNVFKIYSQCFHAEHLFIFLRMFERLDMFMVTIFSKVGRKIITNMFIDMI